MEEPQVSINALPNEILLSILSHLFNLSAEPIPNHFLRAREVCKLWFALIHSRKEVWMKFILSNKLRKTLKTSVHLSLNKFPDTFWHRLHPRRMLANPQELNKTTEIVINGLLTEKTYEDIYRAARASELRLKREGDRLAIRIADDTLMNSESMKIIVQKTLASIGRYLQEAYPGLFGNLKQTILGLTGFCIITACCLYLTDPHQEKNSLYKYLELAVLGTIDYAYKNLYKLCYITTFYLIVNFSIQFYKHYMDALKELNVRALSTFIADTGEGHQPLSPEDFSEAEIITLDQEEGRERVDASLGFRRR